MEKSDIKAGVVVVTKFCKPGARKFQSYIDYVDREEAARTTHDSEYNLFADYMGNPQKSAGLFTEQKDVLSLEEKRKLKEVMMQAQEKGSLMWQTVISFDNRWLEENGLYDCESEIVDEQRLKGIARTAVVKMLKNENLEHAVWSAAIHFNTDNIHIHVATVEPEPMRIKKEYVKYDYVQENGKTFKKPILDGNGNPVMMEEYVGRFKQSSISLCKSSVVNQILNERESNKKINQILRGNILGQKKENLLFEDKKFRRDFLDLYESLPDVNRTMWNYNSNVMSSLHPRIDALTTAYINTYHSEDFAELKENLTLQQQAYQKAYGNSQKGNNFAENKIQDLYTRMGNAILKELKDYDRKVIAEQKSVAEKNGKFSYQKRSDQAYAGYCVASALRSLQRSLKSEYEKKGNEYEHDQMMERYAGEER